MVSCHDCLQLHTQGDETFMTQLFTQLSDEGTDELRLIELVSNVCGLCVCVCVCVYVCARACVYVYVRACVRVTCCEHYRHAY